MPGATEESPFLGWIVHRGLARGPGGTPDEGTLATAAAKKPAFIEIDVQVTRDRHLVATHYAYVRSKLRRLPIPAKVALPRPVTHQLQPVSSMSLQQLRRHVNALTLDQIAQKIGHDTPILLDVADEKVAGPLAEWLFENSDRCNFTICSPSIPALMRLREYAREVPRWLTLPDAPVPMRNPFFARVRGLARQAEPKEFMHAVVGAVRGFAIESGNKRLRLEPFAGIPWRPYITGKELRELRDSLEISGLAVHHLFVSKQLVDVARDLNLKVCAWTVNQNARARRLLECGVNYITTDDPGKLQPAL